jgi:hypothetical protein
VDSFKPLGYRLKHLHDLLEEIFARTLTDFGTDRRQWQLLNTVAREPRSVADLEQALAPFWNEDEPSLLGL